LKGPIGLSAIGLMVNIESVMLVLVGWLARLGIMPNKKWLTYGKASQLLSVKREEVRF